jgi:hypothetical protein
VVESTPAAKFFDCTIVPFWELQETSLGSCMYVFMLIHTGENRDYLLSPQPFTARLKRAPFPLFEMFENLLSKRSADIACLCPLRNAAIYRVRGATIGKGIDFSRAAKAH